MTVPGAVALWDDAQDVIVVAPLDVSTTFPPECRFGPRLIRWVAEPFEDHDHRTAHVFSERDVRDAGDVRAWDDAGESLAYLKGDGRDVVRVIRAVAPAASGFDVTEMNDRDDGEAAALGAKLIREVVYMHAAHNTG